MMGIANGDSTFGALIVDIAILALGICAIVYTVTTFLKVRWNNQKKKNIQAYMNGMRVYDKEILFRELNSLGTKAIKKVYYNEVGDICVQGKICKHWFVLQECPIVSFVSYKNNYRAAAEGEIIVSYLMKKIDPDFPINAFEKEKKNNRLIQLRKRLILVAVVSGVIFMFGMFNPDVAVGENAYIDMVQNCEPDADVYPDITYGEAFNNYFSNPEWTYFVSQDDTQVVEFNGKCLYLEEEADITIQFLLTPLNDTEYSIELHYLGINDASQPDIVKIEIVNAVFEDYSRTSMENVSSY